MEDDPQEPRGEERSAHRGEKRRGEGTEERREEGSRASRRTDRKERLPGSQHLQHQGQMLRKPTSMLVGVCVCVS